MVRGLCPMLDSSDRHILLGIARHSIEQALHHRHAEPAGTGGSAALNEHRASFVTLKCQDQLRGCIGTLEPVRRLSDDVAYNAHAAAFRDPRFPPLAPTELMPLRIEISILGKPEALDVADRHELLERLRPGQDGLIVATVSRRATFLPSVWESLPDPDEFVTHLWKKAGLIPDDWPPDLRLLCYVAENFKEET
ncbi:MAG: AmmeMemoRadiSam system protein A [Gammaproteobacteria bacterium]